MADSGFPAQQQEPPGSTDLMDPVPDHGEHSYVGSGKLTGRTALITGGDSGIGRAVAIAYAREGADVAFTHLAEEQSDAETTVGLIEAAGSRPLSIEADLRETTAVNAVVDQVLSTYGKLDIVVNNAGYQMARTGGIDGLTDEQLERTFTTNVFAMFKLVRACLPHLRASRGCIIINTSIQAYDPSPSLVDYAATKAALNNATVNLAGDLGKDGIRVNAVAPGPIWTPLQPATQPEDKLKVFGSDTPLGRAGQPAEVAPAFVFLASERDSSYVSGTVLGVTGGKPVF